MGRAATATCSRRSSRARASPSSTSSPEPGRRSMVARIEGSDPEAPTLCLMGHTDVVPVSSEGWHEDPFGGELIDGEIWGRGAIDMLNLTASQAVAVPPPRPQRFPAPGHADLLRRGRRGGRRRLGGEVDDRAPLGRDRLRLRAHRDGRLAPRRGPQGRHLDRREGPRLAPPAGERHARPRLDAVPGRQRPDQGGRGRQAPRRLPAAGPPRRAVGGPPRGLRPARAGAPGASSTPTGCSTRWPSCRRRPPSCSTPAPTPRSRPTCCTAASRRT